MIYVNGDSHSAGAEILQDISFAKDDPYYLTYGRKAHPIALKETYGCHAAIALDITFFCDAESASSNARILRTTKDFLLQCENTDKLIVVIGWSTWEREEWKHKNDYLQITAGGTDSVPESMADDYKKWVQNQTQENYIQKTKQWHDKIWDFHNELLDQKIKHVFFNTFSCFDTVQEQQDWGIYYLSPYNRDFTMYQWLINQGYSTVATQSYHFGVNAHRHFAKLIVLYCQNQLFFSKAHRIDDANAHKRPTFFQPIKIPVDNKFNL